METVLKEYKLENNTFDATDLGCIIETENKTKEFNHDFANFAAYSLQKRFHFLLFFVTVGYYNKGMGITEKQKILQCRKNTFQYFVYTTPRLSELKYIENGEDVDAKLFILTTFIPQNVTLDWDCILEVNSPHCNQNVLPTPPQDKYQMICTTPQGVYFCGSSSACYPFSVEHCKRFSLFIVCG